MKRLIVTRSLASCTLAIALALPLGCGGGGGGATPQETFEIANGALKKKDFARFMNCMTPNAQGMMAGMMAMVGTTMKAFGGMMAKLGGEEGGKKFEAATKKIDEVMAKHDVKIDASKVGGMMTGDKEPDPSMLGGLVESVKDKPAFVADMMTAMEAMGDAGPTKGPAEAFEGSMTDVKIDGDSASGTVTGRKGKPMKLRFKKVGSQWLIDNFLD